MSHSTTSKHKENITEWNEGPDKVIEKEGGPGEDVDVEVQHNVNDTSESSFMKHSLKSHLKAAEHKLEHGVERKHPGDVQADEKKHL